MVHIVHTCKRNIWSNRIILVKEAAAGSFREPYFFKHCLLNIRKHSTWYKSMLHFVAKSKSIILYYGKFDIGTNWDKPKPHSRTLSAVMGSVWPYIGFLRTKQHWWLTTALKVVVSQLYRRLTLMLFNLWNNKIRLQWTIHARFSSDEGWTNFAVRIERFRGWNVLTTKMAYVSCAVLLLLFWI